VRRGGCEKECASAGASQDRSISYVVRLNQFTRNSAVGFGMRFFHTAGSKRRCNCSPLFSEFKSSMFVSIRIGSDDPKTYTIGQKRKHFRFKAVTARSRAIWRMK